MAGLPATLPATLGVIDIEFASGTRMRITGPVDAATLSAVTAALVAKDRRR
jgi:transposase